MTESLTSKIGKSGSKKVKCTEDAWSLLFSFVQYNFYIYFKESLGTNSKKKTSYLVTLSQKVGGGQDEITLLGAVKIVIS